MINIWPLSLARSFAEQNARGELDVMMTYSGSVKQTESVTRDTKSFSSADTSTLKSDRVNQQTIRILVIEYVEN